MKTIGSKITWLVVGTALIATAILTALGYFTARTQYLEGIDRQLRAAVEALPIVIGDDYLARATDGDEVDPAEYDALVLLLSDLADRSGVYYLYAFEHTGEEVVHLITSASAAEREAKSWPGFREKYIQPPDKLLATFVDGRTRFTQYTDEFGSFRSIFVLRDVGGAKYVVGADVTLGEINAHLTSLVLGHLFIGGAMAGLCGLMGSLLARRIARPTKLLAREVQSWSARDFVRDEIVLQRLEQLKSRNRDETGELAQRFIDVQNRLQSYLHDLTVSTAARQKFESQLEIAKSIQKGLLPQEPPRIKNFQILGWSQPADETGGDYYDWQKLSDGRVFLTIGDVTGHGIGPALMAAATRAYARAMAGSDQMLNSTMARLNELLCSDMRGERFVTLVACLLDPEARHVSLAAAGHGPILYYNKNADDITVMRQSHGLPLGILFTAKYDSATDYNFAPGDALVLVSDGFFEWLNGRGESFGIERLHTSVLASCRIAPGHILDRLRSDVESFHGGTAQADDTTALIIRCVE